MVIHSSILAWRILRTEEPGGLLSIGLHRIEHDWSDLEAAAAVLHCVYVPQFSHPFICQWTSRLPPCPSYCKQWATRLILQITYMLFAIWSQIFKTRSFLCQMINWLEQYCQAWNMMLPKPEESYQELFFPSCRSSKMQLLNIYFEGGCSGMR